MQEVMMLFPLQTNILYGPVNSRRLGRSLGINLSPGSCKLCSFNCAYCHYGKTERLVADERPFKKDLPAYPEVIEAVQDALRSRMDLDAITFSGNGEPTLHPDFPALVEGVIYLRNRYRPRLKIALLSNSTGLGREDVRRSVMKLDVPVFKLDAGTERTFRKINRPAAGVRFEDIVYHLKSLNGVYIQTILIDGAPSNTDPDEILAYFELIREIRPREVQIYSTDRPVENVRISRVDPEWLEEIASQLRSETEISAVAFYEGKKH
jgi:wyosine [tRNA(Phe)-imidazoG37] synthetase (radical SAM superfamily)